MIDHNKIIDINSNPLQHSSTNLAPHSDFQKKSLRIILLHHKQSENDIILTEFQKTCYHLVYEVTNNINDLTNLFQEDDWALIIANYNGPRYSALNALNITKEISLEPRFSSRFYSTACLKII